MNYDKMQKNFYWITIKCNKSSLQIRYFASLLRGKASERRHARSAINTTQADRRSVVQAMRMHYEHLEVMRQASATSLSPRIAENALQTEFTGYRLPVIVNNAAQSSFSAQGGPPPALGSAPVYDALKWNFFSPIKYSSTLSQSLYFPSSPKCSTSPVNLSTSHLWGRSSIR